MSSSPTPALLHALPAKMPSLLSSLVARADSPATLRRSRRANCAGSSPRQRRLRRHGRRDRRRERLSDRVRLQQLLGRGSHAARPPWSKRRRHRWRSAARLGIQSPPVPPSACWCPVRLLLLRRRRPHRQHQVHLHSAAAMQRMPMGHWRPRSCHMMTGLSCWVFCELRLRGSESAQAEPPRDGRHFQRSS